MSSYRLLRELGSRAQHSYAAMRESDLVVVHRFLKASGTGASGITSSAARATSLDAESMAMLLRDARCLAKNWHPNIARVKHVDLVAGELTIASELIDGATLEDLRIAALRHYDAVGEQTLTLPLLSRVLLDVLAGLHALHGLRDGINAPLGAIHGEICPANIVVGRDGVARIVNVLRARPARISAGSEAIGYAAPEALEAGGTADPRADVYSMGVLLWETLTGKRLYAETSAAKVLARQREEDLVVPSLHPSNPFARLADVAIRALSFDPNARYASIAEMAAEMRRIAGTRLASGAAIAARVNDLVGESIRIRRAELDPAVSATRQRVPITSEVAMRAANRASAPPSAPPASERPSTPSMPPFPPIDAFPMAAHEPAPALVQAVPTPPLRRSTPTAPMRPISPIAPVIPTPSQPMVTSISIPTPPPFPSGPPPMPPMSVAPESPPAPLEPSAVDTFVIERDPPPRSRVLFAAGIGIAIAVVLAAAALVARGVEHRASLARERAVPAADPTPVPMPVVSPPSTTAIAPPQDVPPAPPTGIANAEAPPQTGTTTVTTAKAPPPPQSPSKKKSIYEP